MNYRSVRDLNRIIVENLHQVPDDVDLIVGVPRSGALAANLLALHLNLPLTDVSGYVAGRLMDKGMHRAEITQHAQSVDECRRVLVVDDSILTGSEMRRVREV
ncbi:MAG: phosphoribosyltransferase, partial [Gammaproteobacteria bacterium]|nr:phosphoribosyltransferase [Gammaproteobacteria bacterium]